MKKIKITVGILIVLGSIIGVLVNNKSKVEASAKVDKLTTVPVSVVTVGKLPFKTELSLVGTITGDNDVAIVSETQGKVVRVLAEVGEYKAAGAPIIQIDDEIKKANLNVAQVNYEKAKKDLERYETLNKEKTVSDAQYETIRQVYQVAESQYIIARRQYNDTQIKTPIAGVVTARNVDVGTMVQEKMVVANVVDISKLKVKLNVAESDVFRLKVGDKVEVTTDVYPGVTFEGRLATISDKGDEAHTYPVEISLPNRKEHPLKAGMFGRVSFVSLSQSEALMIPREAIIGSVKKPEVFVVENGVAIKRPIIAGAESGTNVQLLSGLKENETIVVNGHNNLRDSMAVSIIK